MNSEQFFDWMKTLYGTFGKAAPQLHVVAAAFQRVSSLPDGFFAFALEKLQDREVLPQNLGRELHSVLWPEYRSLHPELCSYADSCPECGGTGFIVKRIDTGKPGYGRDVAFQCVCRVGQDEGWTRERIEMAGIVEEPHPVEVTQRAKQALAHLGVHLGELTDSRVDQRVGHLPDRERGEVLAW